MRTSCLFTALFLFSSPGFTAYDADGVPLGASEKDVRKRYPSAHCKALEWSSKAADRRCDDAKASFAGVDSRITIYLNKGVVEAFDVRFDTKFAQRIVNTLKGRYGSASSEERETADRQDRPARQTYKVLWENKDERAVLVSLSDKRRASLLVYRGAFEEEIYRVR